MDIFDAFIQGLNERHFDHSTIKSYNLVLRYFKKHGVSKESIQDYYQYIEHLKVTTRENYLAKLLVFLKDSYPHLVDEVIMPKMPIELPKNIPSKDQIQEILNRPDTSTFMGIRDRAIMELLYSTGIRKQELANLQLKDVDLVQRTIRINQGKMKKDRVVPISTTALYWLSEYIDHVRVHQNPKTNLVFLSNKGERMACGMPLMIVKKYAEHINCHLFRHAFATHLLQNGMKITSVRRLLGHAKLAMTQRYTHLVITDLKASYKKYHPRDTWPNY